MNKTSKILQCIYNQSKFFVRHYPYPSSFRNFLQNEYPGAQYSKLQNGLVVATEERPGVAHACVGFYIDGGTRYESEFENGMAHFFEHLAFKSTRCRNKMQLNAALQTLGATYGCFTTREMACYYVQCLYSDLTTAVEILVDCVFNNGLQQADIENQKCVVYSEMLAHDEDTNAVLYDNLHKSAFQGTGLEKPVMGPSANLYNFDAAKLCVYLNQKFHPSRTVLAACGAVKHELMEQLACRYLNTSEVVHCGPAESHRYTGSEIRYRDDSLPLGNVVMAVEGPSLVADEHIVMEVARYAVGSWDCSQLSADDMLCNRMAKRISTYDCYSYKSFNITYKDVGLWGIQFLADVHSLDDVSIAIQEQWMHLCTCSTEADIERAKRFYKTKLLSKMQTLKGACHNLGRMTLYKGYCPSLLAMLSAIEKVTAADVRAIASEYIYDKCPVVAAIGRIEGLMDYSRLRGQMYWLRL